MHCWLSKIRREGSNQTERMRRLASIFVWHTCPKIRVITKTCLYNFDTIKPHFYIVKLGSVPFLDPVLTKRMCFVFLPSQQTHNVTRTSLQRRCNVTMLQRCCNDVPATLYVCWDAPYITYQPVHFPASILYKSIAGRYPPVRVADGPRTARYRFIKNAYWVYTFY